MLFYSNTSAGGAVGTYSPSNHEGMETNNFSANDKTFHALRVMIRHISADAHSLMRFTLLQRDARCHTQFLHAPCALLIEEGVDGLSRDTAADIAGPVSSSLVRDRAVGLSRSLGWHLSVNAFASALLPRFFARYA